jgi:DNA replication and repair protein RecF
MTSIHRLTITNGRHFESLSIEPCSGINLIVGPNASGKTSILEAIHILAHGKSFRSSCLDDVIHKNQNIMTLFTELTADRVQDFQSLSPQLGLQKARKQSLLFHLNQNEVHSIKALTDYLPIQLITTESTRFFTDGPKLRRDFLAWGLFYSNENYYPVWKKYQRALTQRNHCLKHKYSFSDIKFWDIQLIEAAERLDTYYLEYLTSFKPVFYAILKTFLPNHHLNLDYDRGWPLNSDLQSALLITQEKSYALGYTVVGSHRLDLQLHINENEAQNTLSRGQLKLASYALSLAQGLTLKQMTQKTPIYLIDDLTSELDLQRQALVFDILNSINAQVFITSILPIEPLIEIGHLKQFDLS